MSNPWDSWSSNSDAWNAATYHWEDYYLAPSAYSASLTGYAPDNPNNHIVYPDSVNLTLNGISPDLGISFAPSIGLDLYLLLDMDQYLLKEFSGLFPLAPYQWI